MSQPGETTTTTPMPAVAAPIDHHMRARYCGAGRGNARSTIPVTFISSAMVTLRRQLLIFLLLVLACGVANFAIAIDATKWRRQRISGVVKSLPGDSIEWPLPPPDPWPPPDYLCVETAFAFRRSDARVHEEMQTRYIMSVDDFGWPLPVLSERRFDWPGTGAQQGSNMITETGLVFVWRGVFLNPFIMAAGVWWLLFAPWVITIAVQRRSRRMRGRCVSCGYPLGGAAICPECGPNRDPRST